MKHFLTIILLMAAVVGVQAQRISAYLNSGAVGSQIEGDELKGFEHWNYTGGVGAIAKLTEDGMWSLAVETDYSCLGVFNNKYSSSNLYNISLNLHYINLPITFFFHDPYGGMQIGAGLVYSRLVSQPHGKIRYNQNMFVPDTSDMSFLKNDLAGAIEFRFPVWENLKASVRYQYSIIPVKRDWAFSDKNGTWTRDCYNSALSFRLLWQFGEEKSKPNYSKKKKRR